MQINSLAGPEAFVFANPAYPGGFRDRVVRAHEAVPRPWAVPADSYAVGGRLPPESVPTSRDLAYETRQRERTHLRSVRNPNWLKSVEASVTARDHSWAAYLVSAPIVHPRPESDR